MTNVFNLFGVSNNEVLNGTLPLFGSTIGASNLSPNLPVKTDTSKKLFSTLLGTSDLNFTSVTNPLSADLDCNIFKVSNAEEFSLKGVSDASKVLVIGWESDNPTDSYTIGFPKAAPNVGDILQIDSVIGSSWIPFSSSGDVDGPVSSTDNAMCRFDGITGKLIQESNLIVNDAGDISKGTSNFLHTKLTNNLALGDLNLRDNTSGINNTAIGKVSQVLGTSAAKNTSVGYQSLQSIEEDDNTAIGHESCVSLADGNRNTCLGARSLWTSVSNNDNLCLGFEAGRNYNTTESDNILLMNLGLTGESNRIRIGTTGTHSSCFISGIHNVTPSGATEVVIVDSAGELGSSDSVVFGAVSAIDEAICRFDTISGKLIQNSSVSINDVGDITLQQRQILDVNRIENTAGDLALESSGRFTIDQTGIGDMILQHAGASGTLGIQCLSGALDLQSAAPSASAVFINAQNVAGGVDIDAGTSGIRLDTTGLITLNSTSPSSTAITLNANVGGVDIKSVGSILMSATTGVIIDNTAIEDDSTTLSLNMDAGGFADVKGLNISYETGAINAGDLAASVLIDIDESLSTGGRMIGFGIVSTDQGLAIVDGLVVGSNVNPIAHFSGVPTNAATVLVLAANETTDLSTGGAGNVSIFIANNDTITIGGGSKFSEIGFLVDTPSSGGGVAPTFEFSTGVGTWAFFSPSDGTNGFRNSGIVSFNPNDITWIAGTGSEFLIRIARTRTTLSTTPILDLVQITVTQEFGWDKSANVSVNTLQLLDAQSDKITIQAPALAADYTLTLPIDDGNIDEFLQTNGSGVLSWSLNGFQPGFIYGFQQIFVSVTTISFGTASFTSKCRDDADTINISFTGLQNVAITTSGINGLSSTYTESADQGYDVYVISDSTEVEPTAFLMIEEADDITTVAEFVSDYDKSRLIGWVRNTSSDLLNHIVDGIGLSRTYFYDEERNTVRVLASGNNVVFTDIDCSDFVSPQGGVINLRTSLGDPDGSTLANAQLVFRPDGSTVPFDSDLYTVSPGETMGSGVFYDAAIAVPHRDRIIEYRITSSSDLAFVSVAGFFFTASKI